MNHKKGIFFALISATLFALVAIIIKLVLREVDPVLIVWFRMTIAFTALAAFFFFSQAQDFSILRKPPKLIWIAAGGLAINYICYSLGVAYAGPAATQVVIQLGPILLCVAGFFAFKERFSRRQLFGFFIAFVGLFFFYHQQLISMDIGKDNFIKGVLYTTLSAVAWTAYSVAQKKLVKQYKVQQINLFIYGFSALVYTPFVDFSQLSGLPLWVYFSLFALGLSTIIAYGSIGMAFKHTDASKVSVILILNPIITFLVLGVMESMSVEWIEIAKITFWAYIGAFMMLIGAVLSILPSNKKKETISK